MQPCWNRQGDEFFRRPKQPVWDQLCLSLSALIKGPAPKMSHYNRQRSYNMKTALLPSTCGCKTSKTSLKPTAKACNPTVSSFLYHICMYVYLHVLIYLPLASFTGPRNPFCSAVFVAYILINNICIEENIHTKPAHLYWLKRTFCIRWILIWC